MIRPINPSLSVALSQFAAFHKDSKKPVEGHQELSRFVAWCGRDRKVSELSPAEVAEYAQYAGARVADSAKRLAPVKAFLSFMKKEEWVVTGLASHLRVPRGHRSTTTRKSNSASAQGAQLSREGYDKLLAQLAALKDERVRLVDDIKRAMADKDFRENAPLDAAKERQGFIESQIRDLEAVLATAQVLTGDRAKPQRRVAVGSRVTLKDVASGRRLTYTLVDTREADVASGKISTVSPVGQALLAHTAGDEVVVTVPKGAIRYTIERVGR